MKILSVLVLALILVFFWGMFNKTSPKTYVEYQVLPANCLQYNQAIA